MKKYTLGIATLMLSFQAGSAEYLGSNIDGEDFSCSAYSYETAKYYDLSCEFSGDEVILYFQNGGHISITMDEEEIEDPSSISAFDYNKGNYWEISVDL